MCTKTHIAGFFVKKIRISQIFKEIMLKVCYTYSDKVSTDEKDEAIY